MNRRNFLTTLFGAALAPIAAAKILSSPLKSSHDMLVGYKGSEYFRTGVINAPYIPMAIPDLMSVQPMNMRPGKVFRISYKYDDAAKKIF